MAILDNKTLQTLAHDLAHSFVSSRYPNEANYFPLIWQQFIKDPLPSHRQPRRGDSRSIQGVGVPFTEHRGIELAGVLAVAVTWAVLHQLNVRGIAPDLSGIRMAIESSSIELGAGEQLANELAQELGPQLFEAFQKLSDKCASVYVEQFAQGMQQPQGASYSYESSLQIASNRKHDILIDEVSHRLSILGKKESEILLVPGMQRAMLWLVLTHIGGYITFDDINRLRRPREKADSKLPTRSYYSYRNQLGHLLGTDLRDRIVGKSREHQYHVQYTFTFCWIRRDSNPQLSELLEGLGRANRGTTR